MSGPLVVAWLGIAARTIHDRRTWLTELDAAIGDGDHGINLDRGLSLVVERLASSDASAASPGTLLLEAGRTVLGSVGGASGALYGRAFMRAGARLGERPDPPDVVQAFADAVEGVALLGRAQPGEKTMLDALVPALEALRAAISAGADLAAACASAAAAADAGAQATVPLLARKGRASYLGERSIGHLDPGAASSALLVRALAEATGGS